MKTSVKTREQNLAAVKRYQRKNKLKVYRYILGWQSKKFKDDPHYRFVFMKRANLNRALRSQISYHKDMTELMGIDLRGLKEYIESKFHPGMQWSNRGLHGWHIDHIRPCSSFDLTDPEQQKQCFHYTNLQPLWAHDNLSKGSKILP